MPPDQNRIIEQAKLTYCSLGNVFEKKKKKTIEEQGKKQIQGHLKSMENNKLNITIKKSLQHIQNKTKFMKILLTKEMEEIQDLCKQVDFNDLTYHYKGKNDPNNFVGFKALLNLYRSIKEGNVALEKA